MKELDPEVEGKPLGQHRIRDLSCTSNSIFMTTGKELY